MFRQGQLAVHVLAILIGRNEAGISNRGEILLHHAVLCLLTQAAFLGSGAIHYAPVHVRNLKKTTETSNPDFSSLVPACTLSTPPHAGTAP